MRLPGLEIRGEYRPSFQLIDAVQELFDRNAISYLPLESCTRRHDELRGQKRVQALIVDSKGVHLRKSRSETVMDLSHGSELDWMMAFIRRALAFDQAYAGLWPSIRPPRLSHRHRRRL